MVKCGAIAEGVRENVAAAMGDGGGSKGRSGMARAREISYEVEVQSEGRWTIESVHGHKNAALAAAQALVGANRYEAVRVLEGRRQEREDHLRAGV